MLFSFFKIISGWQISGVGVFWKYAKYLKVFLCEVFFVNVSRIGPQVLLLPVFCFNCAVIAWERRIFKKKVSFSSFCFFQSLHERKRHANFVFREESLKQTVRKPVAIHVFGNSNCYLREKIDSSNTWWEGEEQDNQEVNTFSIISSSYSRRTSISGGLSKCFIVEITFCKAFREG